MTQMEKRKKGTRQTVPQMLPRDKTGLAHTHVFMCKQLFRTILLDRLQGWTLGKCPVYRPGTRGNASDRVKAEKV